MMHLILSRYPPTQDLIVRTGYDEMLNNVFFTNRTAVQLIPCIRYIPSGKTLLSPSFGVGIHTPLDNIHLL